MARKPRTESATLDVAAEVTSLEQMTVGQLQDRYVEVFGEPVRSRHKRYLIRRIAWRLQADAEGGLSERALRRARELANVADARVTPPKWIASQRGDEARMTKRRVRVPDPRLPAPGTAITRKYKGRTVVVTVRPDGFEYEGQRYGSLSAVAKAVTGSHVNGFRFFRLEGQS